LNDICNNLVLEKTNLVDPRMDVIVKKNSSVVGKWDFSSPLRFPKSIDAQHSAPGLEPLVVLFASMASSKIMGQRYHCCMIDQLFLVTEKEMSILLPAITVGKLEVKLQ